MATKRIVLLWINVLLCALMLLGVIFARLRPSSDLGAILFRAHYGLALDDAGVVRGYHKVLLQNGPEYLPAMVDRFLVHKLVTTTSQDLQEAIVDLYVDLAGGREGKLITRTGERTAVAIRSRLASYTEIQQRRDAILLIEEIRLGGGLYKPRLSPDESRETIERAVKCYLRWLEQPMQWQEKRQVDPLQGTDIRWWSP